MSVFARFVLATLCAIILAAIAHITAILVMPWTSANHAAERLVATSTAERPQLISGPGVETWLPLPDPSVAVAACAYDLAEGPFRFSTSSSAMMHSVSFHSRGAGVFFAVTDRATSASGLDIVVMTQEQRDIFETLPAAEDDRALRVVAPEASGFAIIRVLSPLSSQAQSALAEAQQASCVIEPLREPA